MLGFSLITTVPEAAPFAFAWLQRDKVNVFLNSVEAVRTDHPELASRALGGTATLFIMLEAESLQTGVDAMLASIGSRAKLIMAMKDQFYGMREFTVEDPDGYVITFAQQIAAPGVQPPATS